MSNNPADNHKHLPRLAWISHPFRDYPLNSIMVSLIFISLAVILWRVAVIDWDMPLFYYLGLAIFFFSLINYFIPTKYEMFDDKIVIYYWLFKVERSYSDFHCYYSDSRGIMLSTFQKPRRLDAFRGLSLRFSRSQSEKEELLKILEEKIGKKY